MPMTFPLWRAAVGATLLAVSACSAPLDAVDATFRDSRFPPDRTAWTAMPADAQAEHARALHTLLTGYGPGESVTWGTADMSGVLAIGRTVEIERDGAETLCHGFSDRVAIAGRTVQVDDIACWGDGWEYLRAGGNARVLAPAFARSERIYTTKAGDTLARVARRTRTDAARLELLNPGLPDRLPRGTRLLLP